MIPAAACAALAALELDSALIAQTLISRPLVSGALVGALTGRAQAGTLFGASYELLSLCDLPVGGCLTWSAPVAAGVSTILVSLGVSYALCFAGGVAAGVLHSRVEAYERARRASRCDALAARAENDGACLGFALARSLAAHSAMTFAVCLAAVYGVCAIDGVWRVDAPRFLISGVALAASSAPWLGLSGVAAWGIRRS